MTKPYDIPFDLTATNAPKRDQPSSTIRHRRNSSQYGFDTCIRELFRWFRRPTYEISELDAPDQPSPKLRRPQSILQRRGFDRAWIDEHWVGA